MSIDAKRSTVAIVVLHEVAHEQIIPSLTSLGKIKDANDSPEI